MRIAPVHHALCDVNLSWPKPCTCGLDALRGHPWHLGGDAVLHAAREAYGQHEQEQMAFGECGEFVALAGRKVQGRLTAKDMVDEIADVTIMMRQMAHLYGLGEVEDRIHFKLDRLQARIQGSRP